MNRAIDRAAEILERNEETLRALARRLRERYVLFNDKRREIDEFFVSHPVKKVPESQSLLGPGQRTRRRALNGSMRETG